MRLCFDYDIRSNLVPIETYELRSCHCIGLVLIDYKLEPVLTLIDDKIVPIGLVLIDYMLVSVLTLIADKIVPIAWFGIDRLQACVRVDIDR